MPRKTHPGPRHKQVSKSKRFKIKTDHFRRAREQRALDIQTGRFRRPRAYDRPRFEPVLD